jgi:hypothetical protein
VISTQDEKALYESQNGKCSICGEWFPEQGERRLCIDHDHRTRRIRAFLCPASNSALGLMHEDPHRPRNAAA